MLRVQQHVARRLVRPCARKVPRRWSSDDVQMLERLLKEAKEREKTFNAISPTGLDRFPKGKYKIVEQGGDSRPHAILLRSHKLQLDEVESSVRAIARCGAGTNNIPVDKMTEIGIPVFNTPGANANAVKELVICGLLLASRGIAEGVRHVQEEIIPGEEGDYGRISARIEKDKKMFVGREIAGKTLGVIGLGAIGSRVAEAATALEMNVVGYDPVLSLEAAWRLPGAQMTRADQLEDLLEASDYVSIHVPYIPGKTSGLINRERLANMKPDVSILNFARGEIVDGAALKEAAAAGDWTGKYVADFADANMMDSPQCVVIPHLGASTGEAEENSAAMAAETIIDYLETGSIRNSVNFPDASLEPKKESGQTRLTIVNKNEPGVLGSITTFLGSKGINIEQQLNLSRDKIAYTVVDMVGEVNDPEQLQIELADIEGILTSRFIGAPFKTEAGMPGCFYHVTKSHK